MPSLLEAARWSAAVVNGAVGREEEVRSLMSETLKSTPARPATISSA